MKQTTTTLILFFLFMTEMSVAQRPTWSELTKQKKTQKKYHAEQIAALKAYLEVLKKGYGIVQKGLGEIGRQKNASFLRDQQYFQSLKEVSPVVKNSPRIEEIYVCQQKIRNDFQQLKADCAADKNFTPSEIRYISSVHTNMIKQCEVSLDELMFAASSSTEMKDADRLQRLDNISLDMKDKLEFTQSFVISTRSLSRERARERNQADALRKLYGKH